jgi:DNA-binding transcriptional MerR regulator
MAVLEEVLNMKRQGIPEEEIITELRQRGISPREINDALKQAQIKNAVTDYGNEMQPSMMPAEGIPTPNQNQLYQPNVYEESPQQEYAPMPQEYQPQEQQYYVPGGTAAEYSTGIDTDTVIEIADQIVSEKIKKVQDKVENVSETASLLKTKTENISDRLKKIETIIDKLQIAILEKIGSYGKNLESIKKEMSMMQDSFSKMVSSPKRSKKKK